MMSSKGRSLRGVPVVNGMGGQENIPMSLIGLEICIMCPFRLTGCFRTVVKTTITDKGGTSDRWYSIESRSYNLIDEMDFKRASCNVTRMHSNYFKNSKNTFNQQERRYHPNLRQSFNNLSKDMGFKITFDYPSEWTWRGSNGFDEAYPLVDRSIIEKQKGLAPVSFKKGGGCGSLNRSTKYRR